MLTQHIHVWESLQVTPSPFPDFWGGAWERGYIYGIQMHEMSVTIRLRMVTLGMYTSLPCLASKYNYPVGVLHPTLAKERGSN